MFPEIHPDKSPRAIAPDTHHGVEKEAASEANDFISCRKCGYIFDRSKRPKGWRDAITYTAITGTNLKEPVVTGGCPSCGTYEYD